MRGVLLIAGATVALAFPVNAVAAPPAAQHLSHQNVTPGLDGAVKLRHADPNRTLDITVSLGLTNQPALATFLRQVNDPRSPMYKRFLSPSQFAASYSPAPDQVQQVTGYLRSRGLAVASVSGNRTLVGASGPVHAVEAAFGVTISDWHDQRLNRDFFGNDAQPSLPASIAPYVVGVFGLDNHLRFHHHVTRASLQGPRIGGGPAGGYTPTQLKTAYDVNPLASQGINGSGQSLGLFELDGFNQVNITTYDTQYGLATSNPQAVIVGPGPTPALGGGQIEVELDIEIMQAFAPGGAITVWEGNNSIQGAIDTYNAIVTSNSTSSNSTSWGDCEPDLSPTTMATLDNIFKQAAAQGQSFFAASGDFGAYDCRQMTPSSNQVVVDYPASDPYMTGVGGTNLTLKADNSYQSEKAWSNSASSPPSGTGGGLSTQFAQPAWQTGPGVSNSFSNGKRQVPDVALDADPQTGYSVFATNNPPGGPSATGWFQIGGTSAAAPSWAAFAALYNQFAAGRRPVGRGTLGFANPALYGAATNTQTYPPFHDVTTGDNLVYLATAGWDYPTGWGSPDVTNLVADILTARSPLTPWIGRAATGGSPPPGPWYKASHFFPSPLAGAGWVGAVSPPPLAAAGRVGAVSPPPLAAAGRVGALSFMSLVSGRLTTFLR